VLCASLPVAKIELNNTSSTTGKTIPNTTARELRVAASNA